MSNDSGASPWFLIELGCAECGDTPLALPRGLFPSEAEAHAATGLGEIWKAHPNGGSFAQYGDGGFWCAPLDSLSATGAEWSA